MNIGYVASQGNSTEQNTYRFLHTQPASGRNFYRIAQTDLDGRQSYSDTRWVQLDPAQGFRQVLVNPVRNGQLMLQIRQGAPQTVRLLDSQGKLIWVRQLSEGIHSIPLPGLPKGVYLLQAGTQSERVLLQ